MIVTSDNPRSEDPEAIIAEILAGDGRRAPRSSPTARARSSCALERARRGRRRRRSPARATSRARRSPTGRSRSTTARWRETSCAGCGPRRDPALARRDRAPRPGRAPARARRKRGDRAHRSTRAASAPGDLFVAVGRGAAFADGRARRRARRPRSSRTTPSQRSRRSVTRCASGATPTSSRSRARSRRRPRRTSWPRSCRPHRRTVAAEGSQNNEIGLPLTLGADRAGHGGRRPRDGHARPRARSPSSARPRGRAIGVITKIGPVHLELLGTVERVAEAKAELVRDLEPGGTAVVPAGDPLLEPYLDRDGRGHRPLRAGRRRRSSSRSRRAATARPCEVDVAGERARARAALRVALQRGEPPRRARGLPRPRPPARPRRRSGAAEIRLSRWRGEEVPLPGDGLLINDAYNANPLSMAAALEHLRERARVGRTVAVLGDMAELGAGTRPTYHREVGAAARGRACRRSSRSGRSPAAISRARAASRTSTGRPMRRRAIAVVQEVLRPGDCVLAQGLAGDGARDARRRPRGRVRDAR